MNRLQKVVILLDSVESLQAKHSWCGETHLQKTTYFLQTLLDVPLDYEFVLYKYGPFSFELSDELVRIRADGLLKSVPTPPYGTTLQLEEESRNLRNKFAKTREQFKQDIEILTDEIGNKGVKELERLTTIHYIKSQNGNSVAPEAVITRLIELKPHIDYKDGEESYKTLESMIERFRGKH